MEPINSVSVVVTTYNRDGIVQRAIDSALVQTFRGAEVIVVDDGSTDNTAAVLRGYGNGIRPLLQSNAGVSVARNRGFALSRGNVVAFLDSDDEWMPEFLEVQVRALETHPYAIASSANCIIRSEQGSEDLFRTRKIECAPGGSFFGGVSGSLHQPVTSGILLRRNAVERAGGFDLNVSEYEDFDLWTRISLIGGWVYCGTPLWIHHREVLDDANVSWKYWQRPVEAYTSLLRSHERLRKVKDAGGDEKRKLRKTIGHYRCMSAALSIDAGLPSGFLGIIRSLADWPSPRRFARAAALLAGWRPYGIRGLSRQLKQGRRREADPCGNCE